MNNKLIKWRDFLHKNKGKGYSMKKLVKMWHEKKARCKGLKSTECKQMDKCTWVNTPNRKYCRTSHNRIRRPGSVSPSSTVSTVSV